MPKAQRDIAGDLTPAGQSNYTVTNHSDDRSISGTESGAANVAAVLTTLIVDLKAQGIIQADVS